MPIHDWKKVEAGDFHHFHQGWEVAIGNALNRGLLPPGYLAMAEQVTGRPIPDVVALQAYEPKEDSDGGIAIATAPPTARADSVSYARRADRVVIRHGRGKVVAIIEIVSPGDKDSRAALRSFVEKVIDILSQGVHLLVVDMFPPTGRDPLGIHQAIWDELVDERFEATPGKPLTVVSYLGGDIPTAYVEPVGIDDLLPSLPIFLSQNHYISAPLEDTYQETWAAFPTLLKQILESD